VQIPASGILQVFNIKVNINEKVIDAIDPLLAAGFNSSGSLLSEGKVISIEDTFASRFLLNECKLLSCGGSISYIPWKRSK
jgi:hypothetical protein